MRLDLFNSKIDRIALPPLVLVVVAYETFLALPRTVLNYDASEIFEEFGQVDSSENLITFSLAISIFWLVLWNFRLYPQTPTMIF